MIKEQERAGAAQEEPGRNTWCLLATALVSRVLDVPSGTIAGFEARFLDSCG